MANKCTLTKFNGYYQNDNIPKYGIIRFEVKLANVDISQLTPYAGFYFNNATITCVNDTFDRVDTSGNVIESNLSIFTTNGWCNVKLAAKNYVFELSSKYNIGALGMTHTKVADCINIDMSGFNYDGSLSEINIGASAYNNGIHGNLEFSSDIITQITLCACETRINIDTLGNANLLKKLVLYNANNAEGSVLSLSKAITLTNLQTVGTKINGELTTLFSNMVFNGRTSGIINIQGKNSNVTIEGLPYNEYVVSHGGTQYMSVTFDASVPDGYTMAFS